MAHTLDPPATEDDWQAFHDIRDDVLFKARHRDVPYDRNHPDDFTPANTPLLLKDDGRPVGTIRLDDRGDGTGVVRLVAVIAGRAGPRARAGDVAALRRAGARQGARHALRQRCAGGVGFYEKMGWERHIWSDAELVGIAADCIQMRKRL